MTSDTTWRMYAECRGDSAVHFFAPNHFERKPERDSREYAARTLCRRCPVSASCLDYAMTVDEPHGIWGGLNELERSRLKRKQSA